ncbi:MAG: efflux transporter outer membrane subunit [Deltaproteobacteria bacterium]|nr:efflux transporter outer membrane subunit [Deltaproteobacteria bacterium]
MRFAGMFLAAMLVLTGVSGCTLGPDFVKPDMTPPSSYRTDIMPAVSADELKWWELFDDPVLYDLVTVALENNKDVKLAVSRMDEARASLGFTRADQFPRLDLQGGANRGTFSGGVRSEDTNYYAYIAPVLSWEIDFWGKFRRATESARAALLASEYGVKTVQLALVSQVASTYYLLLDYHQRLAISKATLKSRMESMRIVGLRFEKGTVPEIDLNQAQIQTEIAVESIPFYERLIANTENALSVLLGRFPEAIPTGKELKRQDLPPDIPAGIPAGVLARRPDVSEAMYALQAQTAQIGVAQALRLPAINLTGLLGVATSEVSNIQSDGGVWSIGGSLLGPIYDFGKNQSRVEIEEALTEQARYRYEKAVLTAMREVNDALVDIESLQRQTAAIERRLKAAANANFLSKERYDKGVTSYLEVLDSERTLFEVELGNSERRQQLFNAYVQLYKALGGGWMTKEAMAQQEEQATTP